MPTIRDFYCISAADVKFKFILIVATILAIFQSQNKAKNTKTLTKVLNGCVIIALMKR